MLRTGTLRSSARRGTARELAALRHPRLFALAGPAVLGSLEGGLEDQDQQQEHPRMVWIYWVQLWHLIWVRLERAEHRRGIRGEEAPRLL